MREQLDRDERQRPRKQRYSPWIVLGAKDGGVSRVGVGVCM